MKASDIHEALTLLPEELLLETDCLRRTAREKKTVQWKHLVPLVACLMILLNISIAFLNLPAMSTLVKKESTTEAPAAAAPMEMEMAADEAAPQDAPAADMEAPAEENRNQDHLHAFAEDTKSEEGASVTGGCGNTQAIIVLDGKTYSIAGSDAITLNRLLDTLPYDPDAVCRCMAEFTVDTELLTGIEVSLTNAFARSQLGQASLTAQQTEQLRQILDQLG